MIDGRQASDQNSWTMAILYDMRCEVMLKNVTDVDLTLRKVSRGIHRCRERVITFGRRHFYFRLRVIPDTSGISRQHHEVAPVNSVRPFWKVIVTCDNLTLTPSSVIVDLIVGPPLANSTNEGDADRTVQVIQSLAKSGPIAGYQVSDYGPIPYAQPARPFTLSTGAIIGIAIGGAVVLATVVFGIILILRERRRRRAERSLELNGFDHLLLHDVTIGQAIGERSIFGAGR